MNDRFKFRVWDVQHQKYAYYDLLDSTSLSDFAFFAEEIFPDYNEQIKAGGDNCWGLIIEQCTGLTDNNGNFVYEGDICKVTGSFFSIELESQVDIDFIDKVSSLEKFFGEALIGGIYAALECDTLKVEVIGNIRENGDLLK